MRGSPHCDTRIAVRCTCNAQLSNSKRESFIGSTLSEGSGAKFEVYLGIATAARAL